MDQWGRSLTALAEDSGSIPIPTRCLTAICNSNFRGRSHAFWPLSALHAHGTQINMQAKQIQNKMNFKKLKWILTLTTNMRSTHFCSEAGSANNYHPNPMFEVNHTHQAEQLSEKNLWAGF